MKILDIDTAKAWVNQWAPVRGEWNNIFEEADKAEEAKEAKEDSKMTMKNYLILCVAVAVVVSVTILFVPGVSESIESRLLTFLSTNAR